MFYQPISFLNNQLAMYFINRKLVLLFLCASFVFFNKAHILQFFLKYISPAPEAGGMDMPLKTQVYRSNSL
jgi:hypothetical protein